MFQTDSEWRAIKFTEKWRDGWSLGVVDHRQGAWLFGVMRGSSALLAGWNQDVDFADEGGALYERCCEDSMIPSELRAHLRSWSEPMPMTTFCGWCTDGLTWKAPKWMTSEKFGDPFLMEDVNIIAGGAISLSRWLGDFHEIRKPALVRLLSDRIPITRDLARKFGARAAFTEIQTVAIAAGYPAAKEQ